MSKGASRSTGTPTPGVLSRAPGNTWPEGFLHHGARALLLGGLGILVTALFPPEDRPRMARYEVGTVAESDIIAEVPFAVPLTPEELERRRQEARASVPPTFNYRPEAVDTMASRLDRFFTALDSAAGSADTARVQRILQERSIEPSELLYDPAVLRRLRQAAIGAVRQILPVGVADGSQLEGLTPTIVVREPDGEEGTVDADDVLSPREFHERAVDLFASGASPEFQQLLRLILIQHTEPSFVLNDDVTRQNRDDAARAVPTTKQSVAVNEAIVRANQRIEQAEVEVLDAYTAALQSRGMLEETGRAVTPFFGSGLLNLLLLAVFGLLLFFFRPEVYTNFRWIALIALLVAAYMVGAAAIVRNELPTELLPIAFVALAVAVLWDGRMALVLVTVLAVLTGIQPTVPGDGVVATTLVGGAAAALSVRAVRRRAQTWIFIAVISLAYAAVLLAQAMVFQWDPPTFLWSMGAASGNAALSAILAMGFVPVFELFTGITTDQTLLEWADSNQPLLRRLSMEAPGTYAHTINVANLAEAAANTVAANGLLCRVGLFYHDVGKMLKPHYFVENQPDGRNPHDRLKPDTSAAIVKEHVVEGLRLARDEKVPDVITAFIPEHHGTQLISFFWEKAKEEYGEDNLDVADFTYPGPKPQSKETAIAMLADSVESATRALQDPTPERVRDLIENIVDAKVADRQLDDSPVTLREIRQIKEQFIKVLSGIYHHRIDYPQTKHLTDAPEPPPAAEPTAAAEAAVPEAPEAPKGPPDEPEPEPPEEPRVEAAATGSPAGEPPSDADERAVDGRRPPDSAEADGDRAGTPEPSADREATEASAGSVRKMREGDA